MKLLPLFIVGLTFSITAYGDELPITYKCFIETQHGADIANFSWLENDLVKEQAAILTQDVSTMTGKRGVVRHIDECVKLDQKFKSKIANKIDQEITQ
ncbi:TapY2 family type IVa secretion system protein [Shewanella sp. OMA3-2]|uniref:TapY2 family type IVa secretion system protein n=1 Tax=Shewanella sp. OMA3-2 TaxID=2908650 RepID=UPI001F1B17BE|nr:TapY2 family type IVa secretion system protein [Shewanella sp. OMA3-2]UJF23093.1 TapY2 family type IVa secretion system protein [Shewanella sp. OMA3-2]